MTKTVVDLDDDLLRRAQQLLGTRTKRETVDRALRELVERVERLELLDFMTSTLDLEVLADRDRLWER